MLEQHEIYSQMSTQGSWEVQCYLHNISAFDFLQANKHDLQLDNIEDTDNTLTDQLVPKLMRKTELNCSLFDQIYSPQSPG